VQLNKKIKISLSKLTRTEAQRILDKIAELEDNPKPHGSKNFKDMNFTDYASEIGR
jgi:mRNA-degrading endonuclease RelE of RelBE toxin-antitoxin system